MMMWRALTGAVVVVLAAASGCQLPARLGGDSIDPSSRLYGLELVDEREVATSVREPSDLAFDASTGTFWTVSDQRGTVHRISTDGAAVGEPLDAKAIDLEGVALDPKTGHLFVVDEATSTIVEMTRDGTVLGRTQVAVQGGNTGLEGIAYDPATDGFVLAKEARPAELLFVDRRGAVASRASVQTQDLSAVAVSPDGASIFVVGRFEEAVLEVDRRGRRKNRLALNVPAIEGIAFDARGRLFAVADLGGNARGKLYTFARKGEK